MGFNRTFTDGADVFLEKNTLVKNFLKVFFEGQ